MGDNSNKKGKWFLIVVAVIFIFLSRAMYVDSKYPKSYGFQIVAVSQKYDLEPSLVAALIKNTSNFKPKFKDKDRIGMMGVSEAEAYELAQYLNVKYQDVKQLEDPDFNIAIGAIKLHLIQKEEEDTVSQIIRYLYGKETLKKWMAEGGNYVDSQIDRAEKKYVKKIYHNYLGYQKNRQKYYQKLSGQIGN